MFDGIELIVSLIGRYTIFEEIYLQEKTPATDILRPALTKLYASILKFLAEAKHYHVQKTGIRIIKGVLVNAEWLNLVKIFKMTKLLSMKTQDSLMLSISGKRVRT